MPLSLIQQVESSIRQDFKQGKFSLKFTISFSHSLLGFVDFTPEQLEGLFSFWQEVPSLQLGKGAFGEVFKSNNLAIKWMRNLGHSQTSELSQYNRDEWILLEELPFHPLIAQYLSRFKFKPPRDFLSRMADPYILYLLFNRATQQPLPQQFVILEYFARGNLKEFLYKEGRNIYKPEVFLSTLLKIQNVFSETTSKPFIHIHSRILRAFIVNLNRSQENYSSR